ncbi:SCO3242 family prenyltransferase [Actinokineospora guangxiensis]|uniref:SCO3242 family prenyltransferase n=1 Tax=Actinokineospora guangxiensis TaxID=1490288 RepID=A0ABW0EWH8_9PSEU
MRAYVELVRAPAALTVLGDTVAGAAFAGGLPGRAALLPLASVAFYWSGMALNDWSDRALDADERPERPIPSGRVEPGTALAVAAGLTAAGFGLAAVAGRLRAAVPLAAAVWAYDLLLKNTPAGPLGMAACRGLDVLMGGGRPALPAALAIGGHTLGVTALSRGEVHGTSTAVARGVLGGTAAAALAAATGRARSWRHRLLGTAGAAAYAGFVGRAQLAAVQAPDAVTVRTATKAGIHGMVPLQSALAARAGSARAALLVACALPLARRLGRKVGPT